jgi:hypothetical protein
MLKARIKKTKISTFNSNVKSVRLHGCETWEVTNQIKKQINHLTPNDHFSGRTAQLTYRCWIF